MSRQLGNRLAKLEARQADGMDHEEVARWRAKRERIRERAKENPEGHRAYMDAEDALFEAIEEARVRSRSTGEDPEDAPEVWEAIRAVERVERLLLGEDAAGPI